MPFDDDMAETHRQEPTIKERIVIANRAVDDSNVYAERMNDRILAVDPKIKFLFKALEKAVFNADEKYTAVMDELREESAYKWEVQSQEQSKIITHVRAGSGCLLLN